MRSTRWIIVVGVALALLSCRREPDVDSSKAAASGKDVTVADPARAPDTVTIVGTLTALGKAPDVIPGDIAAEQTVTLRVESAEGADLAAGTTVEILITITGHVPAISDPAPELDPAYFRVGRRFRIATLRAGARYHAKIDKTAIEPLD